MSFPWLTVFLPGTHQTSAPKKTWSVEDQKSVVANTKKFGNDMIPFVGGHPKNGLPIFGYFSKDDIRIGEHKGLPAIQVRPSQFAQGGFEALSKSEHDKVSISITKGVIDHIGFVKNPAVKDLPALGSYQFSADPETESMDGQFAWQTGFEYAVVSRFAALVEVMQGLREDMIAKDGNTDRADKAIPKDLIDTFTTNLPQLSDDLQYMIADEVQKQLSKSKEQPSLFEDNMPNDKKTEDAAKVDAPVVDNTAQFEAANAALKTENEALTKRIAALETENQTAKFCAAVDACVADGRVLPAERDMHIRTLNSLALVDTAHFAADAKTPTEEYIDALKARTPMTAMFGQVATNGVQAPSKYDDEDKAIEEFNKSRSN